MTYVAVMLVEQALRALAHRRAELALGTIDQFTQQIYQVNDVVGVAFALGLVGAAVRCPVIGHLATSPNVFASARGPDERQRRGIRLPHGSLPHRQVASPWAVPELFLSVRQEHGDPRGLRLPPGSISVISDPDGT